MRLMARCMKIIRKVDIIYFYWLQQFEWEKVGKVKGKVSTLRFQQALNGRVF